MNIAEKLEILADAAKYDASCASSGAPRRNARETKGGIGSTTGSGICHSYAPDGRCISLLKILLTNFCMYDCLYCINRLSSDVRRARFSVDEVVQLTLDFYRRNYIEGLFLSSGIIRNPDYTMEQLVQVAKKLRVEHEFRGYIHLKTIPEASRELIAEAGKWADRISINLELPTQQALDELAPAKNLTRIKGAMDHIKDRIAEAKVERRKTPKAPAFSPGGQSTQIIVGATEATDQLILARSSELYREHKLKRVYYSAYSPIPHASAYLPPEAPPLVREHRLYQADWLVRFYGFEAGELTTEKEANLSLEKDPKLAWALRNPEQFPVNLNRAPRGLMLRVPGLGVRNTDRLLRIRMWKKVRLEDLTRLKVPVKKAMPFIETADFTPHKLEIARVKPKTAPAQMDFFRAAPPVSILTGEL